MSRFLLDNFWISSYLLLVTEKLNSCLFYTFYRHLVIKL